MFSRWCFVLIPLSGLKLAGVEVSVDGGATWHPATGTEQWRYEWQVPDGSGAATILSCAVDDSVNLETPREGVTIGCGRPAAR